MRKSISILLSLFSISLTQAASRDAEPILVPRAQKPKIIGLMQVRNEAPIIEQALRGLAVYTDEIIVLDDASDDDTPAIVQTLAKELHITEIIQETLSGWTHRTEIENRQKLLDTGRAHGGTHFIELDADEIFTALCAKDNWLRKQILALEKGQILHLPIINLWKSFDFYRSRIGEFPDIVDCSAIFCDDGISTLADNKRVSHSGFIHFGRFPVNRVKQKPDVYSKNLNYSILHLPFVNWDNTFVKRGWIMCLEVIRLKEGLSVKFPGRTVRDINDFYKTFHNYSEEGIELKPTPPEWLDYSFFDKACYTTRLVTWRKQQVLNWFKHYGRDYFKDLDIWHINWE